MILEVNTGPTPDNEFERSQPQNTPIVLKDTPTPTLGDKVKVADQAYDGDSELDNLQYDAQKANAYTYVPPAREFFFH